MKVATPRLVGTWGDEVAEEALLGRTDLISLASLVAAILLLVGMAWAIPAEPVERTSICRSPANGAAAKRALPVTPDATRLKARPDS